MHLILTFPLKSKPNAYLEHVLKIKGQKMYYIKANNRLRQKVKNFE